MRQSLLAEKAATVILRAKEAHSLNSTIVSVATVAFVVLLDGRMAGKWHRYLVAGLAG